MSRPRFLALFPAFVLFLILMLPAPVHAQPLACSASTASTPSIRAEGLAELVGDLLITCTGGTTVTTGPVPQVSVILSLNTAVTSRVLGSAIPALTEALLFIDDPAPASQVPCVAATCQNTDNVIQGTLPEFNRVQFLNVPLNPPGPTGTRTLRIKNVRVNSTLIPVNGSVIALVIVSGAGAPTAAVTNPQQTLASVRQTLGFDIRTTADAASAATPAFVACTGSNLDLAANNAAVYSTPGGRSLHIRFSETGVPNAFRRRVAGTTLATPTTLTNQDSPAAASTTESGFYNANLTPANGLNRAGLADHGTRLRAQFSNIPANLKVFVTVREVNPGTTASAKAVLTNSPGPFSAIAADSTADGGLKLVPASGEVVWEILEEDPAAAETVSFGVVLAYSANPQPATATATVVGSYSPINAAGAASPTDPIPRHVSLLTPINAFTINACRTTLLFQFLSNRAGFDTGIAVTNTSRDTLGTANQSGRCTATFFPTPTNQTYAPLQTPNILAAGEQWIFAISATRPGFQGYMMVTCDFQFAHGYAFISDFGAEKLAQGYQALVIPDRPRVADPTSTSGAGSGEQLIH
jgi:hypothetical protein